MLESHLYINFLINRIKLGDISRTILQRCILRAVNHFPFQGFPEQSNIARRISYESYRFDITSQLTVFKVLYHIFIEIRICSILYLITCIKFIWNARLNKGMLLKKISFFPLFLINFHEIRVYSTHCNNCNRETVKENQTISNKYIKIKRNSLEK